MKVKVFSTQTGEKTIETSAKTWGELQQDLSANNVPYNKMKAVVGETKMTLEAAGAVLPEAGFTLFLMNKKTKAGLDSEELTAMSYRELRGAIKKILDKKKSAKEHFNVGKNYTTKGTEELRRLLGNYYEIEVVIPEPKKKAKKKAIAKTSTKEKETPTKEESVIEKAKKTVAKTAADVVESVKESKLVETPKCQSIEELNLATKILGKVEISDLDADAQAKVNKLVGKIVKITKKLEIIWDNQIEEARKAAEAKAEKERLAKEKAEKEEAERKEQEVLKAKVKEKEEAKAKEKAESEAKLNSEMNDLRGEFNDVK